MRKTLTAGLTALSLALIPAAPVQAQQSNNDLNRALLGLLAAGAVGLAIKNHADNGGKAEVTVTRNQTRSTPVHTTRNAQRSRGTDLVPGRCFRRIETRRGDFQGVFDGSCLDRRYKDASALPRQCAVRMGGRDGRRTGYAASCLRDHGYRSDRRWN